MLEQIKRRIEAAGCCDQVDLGGNHEMQDGRQEGDPEIKAVLYFGDRKFADNSTTSMGVEQKGLSGYIVQLMVDSDDLEETEQALIKAVVGYQHTDFHEPLVVSDVSTHWIVGERYSRILTFTATNYITKL